MCLGFAVQRVDAAGAGQAMSGLEMMGWPRDADPDEIEVVPHA